MREEEQAESVAPSSPRGSPLPQRPRGWGFFGRRNTLRSGDL